MTRAALVLATLAAGLGLATAGVVRAEDPASAPATGGSTGSTGNEPASGDQKPSQPAAANSSDSQTYSPKPLPGDTTGVYLPSAVGGYVRSTASCVVLGCDSGPEVKVGPSSSASSKESAAGPPTDSGPAGALH